MAAMNVEFNPADFPYNSFLSVYNGVSLVLQLTTKTCIQVLTIILNVTSNFKVSCIHLCPLSFTFLSSLDFEYTPDF